MPTAHQRTSQRKISGTVLGGKTEDFDCVPFTDFRGVKYFVKAYSTDQDLYNTYEITGTRDASDVSDQLTNKFLVNLNISLNLVKDGADVCLRILNNELFTVTVDISKSDF